jgi:hypothetical protein
MKTRVIVAFLATMVLRVAFGHHSFAPHFDPRKPLRVTGTVTRFDFRNPHVYLYVDAIDENGRHREYVCSSRGATQLMRVGISPKMLALGATVTLAGPQARDDPYGCFFQTVEFPDGRVFRVDGKDSPVR